MALGLVRVQADRQVVEEQLRRHGLDQIGLVRPRVMLRRAAAQFHRAGQVDVAPQGVLRLVTELLHGVGFQGTGCLVVRLGEGQVVAQGHRPAVVALVDGRAHQAEYLVGATERLDVVLAGVDRGQRIEVRRVAVVVTQVALVHGAGVVAERAVVAAGVPLPVEIAGQPVHLLGDFRGRQPLVCQVQRAVVEEGVHVALVGEQGADTLAAPGRPVVRDEHHVGLVAITLQGRVDVLRPGLGVAH
ncbi:hypothetical protein D9M71_252990 [compost metagenome]